MFLSSLIKTRTKPNALNTAVSTSTKHSLNPFLKFQVKHVSRSLTSRENREKYDLKKMDDYLEAVEQEFNRRMEIAKQIEEKYKTKSENLVSAASAKAADEVKEIYFVPLTKNDELILASFFRAEVRDDIRKGGRLVLLDEVRKYNKAHPFAMIEFDYEPLDAQDFERLKKSFSYLLSEKQFFVVALQQGKKIFEFLEAFKKHKADLHRNLNTAFRHVEHLNAVESNHPLRNNLSVSLRKIDNAPLVKSLLANNKIEEKLLSEKFNKMYFEYLDCLNSAAAESRGYDIELFLDSEEHNRALDSAMKDIEARLNKITQFLDSVDYINGKVVETADPEESILYELRRRNQNEIEKENVSEDENENALEKEGESENEDINLNPIEGEIEPEEQNEKGYQIKYIIENEDGEEEEYVPKNENGELEAYECHDEKGEIVGYVFREENGEEVGFAEQLVEVANERDKETVIQYEYVDPSEEAVENKSGALKENEVGKADESQNKNGTPNENQVGKADEDKIKNQKEQEDESDLDEDGEEYYGFDPQKEFGEEVFEKEEHELTLEESEYLRFCEDEVLQAEYAELNGSHEGRLLLKLINAEKELLKAASFLGSNATAFVYATENLIKSEQIDDIINELKQQTTADSNNENDFDKFTLQKKLDLQNEDDLLKLVDQPVTYLQNLYFDLVINAVKDNTLKIPESVQDKQTYVFRVLLKYFADVVQSKEQVFNEEDLRLKYFGENMKSYELYRNSQKQANDNLAAAAAQDPENSNPENFFTPNFKKLVEYLNKEHGVIEKKVYDYKFNVESPGFNYPWSVIDLNATLPVSDALGKEVLRFYLENSDESNLLTEEDEEKVYAYATLLLAEMQAKIQEKAEEQTAGKINHKIHLRNYFTFLNL